MLRKRIIPRILVKKIGDRQVSVISKNYKTFFTVGNPLSQAKIMDSNKADEISIINVDSYAPENNDQFLELLRQIVACSMTPISAGGSVSSYQEASALMSTGIEKITIPIRADSTNLLVVKKIAQRHGSQAVQASLDYLELNGGYALRNNHQFLHESEIYSLLLKYIEAGAGEVAFCNVEKDGSKSGLDISLFNSIAREIPVPSILGGGVKDIDNFVEAFKLGADGVVSGTYIAKMDHSLLQIRSKIAVQGINVREISG
jgi:cyclase